MAKDSGGQVSQLNFKVFLDDTEFNKSVDKVIGRAKKLNMEVNKYLDLQARVARSSYDNAAAVTKAQEEQRREIVKTKIEEEKLETQKAKTAKAQTRINEAVKDGNLQMTKATGIAAQLGSYIGRAFSIYTAERFLSSLVKITGEFEVQQQALRTILRDTEKADMIFGQLRQFAVESPYTFKELASYTKQLAAFNIPADNLLETNKMLADVAAGLGVSMDRLILAYGHIKSSGFLRGMQLRQLTQNGVPILEQLSDILSEVEGKTITIGEVFDKMTRREIPFEYVEEGFKRMTAEGGQFYRMQEVLVETIQGRMGKLKDVWDQAVYDIGEANSREIKDLIDGVIGLIGHLGELVAILGPVVAGFGSYLSVLALVKAGQKVLALGQFISEFVVLTQKIGLASTAVLAFGASWKSVAGALGIVSALIVGIVSLIKKRQEANKIATESGKVEAIITSTYQKQLVESSKLIAQLEQLKVGTEEYNNVKDALLKTSGKYLSETDREAIAVGNLAGVYDHLADNIRKVARERVVNEAASTARSQYAEVVADVTRRVRSGLTTGPRKEMSAEVEGQIIPWVLGLVKEVPKEAMDYFSQFSFYSSAFTDTGYFGQLRKEVEAADKILEAAETRAKTIAETMFKGEDKTAPMGPFEKNWRDTVRTAIKDLDPDVIFKAKLTPDTEEEYFEYIDRLGKSWKTLSEEKDKALAVDKPAIQALLDGVKVVDRALEGNVLSDARNNKTPWRAPDHSETEEKRRLNNLIQIYTKLGNVYSTLMSKGMTDEAARSTMKTAFAGLGFDEYIDGVDFQQKINELTRDMDALSDDNNVRSLAGLNFAIAELNRNMAQTANEAKATDAALKKYKDAYATWLASTANLEGSGLDFKVSGIIEGARVEKAKVDKRLTDNIEKAKEAHKGNAEAIADETEKLEALAEAEKKNIDLQTQERLNNLSKDVLKSIYADQNIDLKNLSHASLTRLASVQQQLVRGAEDIAKYIPDVEGYDTASLLSQVMALLDTDLERVTDQKMQALQRRAKVVLDTLSGVAGLMDSIADGSDNVLVQGFAEASVFASSLANSLAESEEFMKELAKDGGTLGSAMSAWVGTTSSYLFFLNLAVEAAGRVVDAWKNAQELHEKYLEAEQRYNDILRERRVDDADNIFGTNWVKKIRAQKQNLEEYAASVKMLERAWSASAGEGGPVGGIMSKYYTDGVLDWDKVAAAYDAGVLEGNFAEIYEKYVDAAEAFSASIEEIFGDLASSIADDMVNAFLETGDAVADLDDTINDLKISLGKLLSESVIMEWLEEGGYVEGLTGLVSKFAGGEIDEEQLGTEVDALMTAINDGLPGVADTINRILTALGVTGDGTSAEEDSLTNGIKGITEETANLLASYLNAIRADVSVMRMMATTGWENVKGILQSMPAPTIWENIASINAHTANIELYNRQMLSELRSVIRNGSDGRTVMFVESI